MRALVSDATVMCFDREAAFAYRFPSEIDIEQIFRIFSLILLQAVEHFCSMKIEMGFASRTPFPWYLMGTTSCINASIKI